MRFLTVMVGSLVVCGLVASPPIPLAAGGDVDEREEGIIRECKKKLNGDSRSEKIGALEQLSALNGERPSMPSRQISLAVALGLKDADIEVQKRAAELLPENHPEVAVRKLCDALKRLRGRHRAVYRQYLKNVEKFLKLFQVDTSENLGQNIQRLNQLWSQFVEASNKLYEKLLDTRAVYQAVIDGMVKVPHEDCFQTIKEYYRNVSNYSFRDSIPCVKALLAYGVRSGVERVITDYEKYYDYEAMQKYIDELEDRDPRSQDFIDWGEAYHEALAEMAEARKLSDAPAFGSGVDTEWLAWWEKHKETFSHEITPKQ